MDFHVKITTLLSLMLIISFLRSFSSTQDFDHHLHHPDTGDLLDRNTGNLRGLDHLLHHPDTGDLLHRNTGNLRGLDHLLHHPDTGDLLHHPDTGDLLHRDDNIDDLHHRDDNIDDLHHRTMPKRRYNVLVAKDGTGTYKSVKEAILRAPDNMKKRYIIYIKRGIYEEIINISEKKTYITLVGDGMDTTIITGNLSNATGYGTTESATLTVDGLGFMAQYLSIRNTVGPAGNQAVALLLRSDFSVLYRCKIEGYQDTLYLKQYRQFFRECHISGTVDFICGDSAAVFQNCIIEARRPMKGQFNVLTVQNAGDTTRNSGFTFQKCHIVAGPDLIPIKKSVKTFLGRPWSNFSTVVFLGCTMDDLIDPAGWSIWTSKVKIPPSTIYYGEFRNNGLGARTGGRIRWPGYHIISDPNEAIEFMVVNMIKANLWLKSTGVPYDEGL